MDDSRNTSLRRLTTESMGSTYLHPNLPAEKMKAPGATLPRLSSKKNFEKVIGRKSIPTLSDPYRLDSVS
jgi:hypothetical protein